ncbi:MAG: PEP-CTERM sorting domain-containing protein [Opitutaceae bacterium]
MTPLKTSLKLAALASLVAASSQLSAATIVPLFGLDAQSSTPLDSGLATTLDDAFAYDPDAPTTPEPNLGYSGTNGWHGTEANAGDVTLVYLVDYTVGAADTFHFDLYGRSGNGGSRFLRDDDYDVLLYSGGTSGTLLGSALNEGIPSSPRHNRTSFAGLSEGANIDTIVIVGHDSQGDEFSTNNFTILEARAAGETGVGAAVPEPSSAGLLLGLASVGFLAVRRRK